MIAAKAFGENHAASIMAKEKNGRKPTPASLLSDIQKACVEHSHGVLWNSMDYDTKDIVSIDMNASYPASFQGLGDGKPHFDRFGHPSHRMTAWPSTIPFLKILALAFPRSRNGSSQTATLLSPRGLENISRRTAGLRHSFSPSWQSLASWKPSESVKPSLPLRNRPRFGSRKTAIRGAASSASSLREVKLTEKECPDGWWSTKESSTSLSETTVKVAHWLEHRWDAPRAISSRITTACSPRKPI